MDNKSKFIFKYSLKNKLTSKSFIIVNIIFFLVIMLALNFTTVINFFGGDFASNTKILVITTDDSNFDNFKGAFDTLNDNMYDVTIAQEYITFDSAIESASSDDVIVKLNFIDEDGISISSIDAISSSIYTLIEQSIDYSYKMSQYSDLGLDETQIVELNTSPTIIRNFIEDGKITSGNDERQARTVVTNILTYFVVLPFIMLVMTLVQMLGSEINAEKSTKSMEIIMSSVSAKKHLFAKVLSTVAFTLIQLLLFVIYFAIAYFVSSKLSTSATSDVQGIFSQIDEYLKLLPSYSNLWIIVILSVISYVLTFLLYSFSIAILASLSSSPEDLSQIYAPLSYMSIAALYLLMFMPLYYGSNLILACSYIPFLSFALAPYYALTGELSIFGLVASNIILLIALSLLVHYGLKIYKAGVLNYSSGSIFKKAKNAIR